MVELVSQTSTSVKTSSTNQMYSAWSNKSLKATASAVTVVSSAAKDDSSNRFSDLSLLRGVPASAILRHRGLLFAPPGTRSQFTMAENGEMLYGTSREVTTLHWFISHSWRASRWQKYLALCMTLRGRKAIMYAVGASLCYVAFEVLGVRMPTFRAANKQVEYVIYGYVYMVFGCVYFTMLFWPPSARRSWDPDMFLDKCCIHQTDPVRKARGIAKLGAFLRNSERMLVLWSLDYCERLWCIYELASFISVNGIERIDFVNLQHPAIELVFILMLVVAMLGKQITASYAMAYYPYVLTVLLPVFVYMVRTWSRQLRVYSSLRQKMNAVTLDNAQCFCCTVNHIMPDVESVIPCDREFVKENVAKWFRELCSDGDTDGVETFERIIHDDLLNHVLRRARPLSMSVVLKLQCFLACLSAEVVVLNVDHRVLLFGQHNMFNPIGAVFVACVYVCQLRNRCLLTLTHRWPRAWDCTTAILMVFATILGHAVSFSICAMVAKIENVYLAVLALILIWLSFIFVFAALSNISLAPP